MLIEKHKYDQISDTKVASLFPFHILSYKYARRSVKTKQYRNLEKYNILSEKVKVWKKNQK